MQAPRVIWAGIHDSSKNLLKIRDHIEETLAAEGFPTESKSFSPHLTLGRVKDHASCEGLYEIMKNIKLADQILRISEIRLMESVLTPRGPKYSCIHIVKLQEHSSQVENIH